MQNLVLFQMEQVTLDGSGNGSVSLGPATYDQEWYLVLAAVTIENMDSTNDPEPECRLFVDGMLIAGTYSGSLDSTDLNLMLSSGQKLTASWTGGPSGKVGKIVIQGTKRLSGG